MFVVRCLGRNRLCFVCRVRLITQSEMVMSARLLLFFCTFAAVKGNQQRTSKITGGLTLNFSSTLELKCTSSALRGLVRTPIICTTAYRTVEYIKENFRSLSKALRFLVPLAVRLLTIHLLHSSKMTKKCSLS